MLFMDGKELPKCEKCKKNYALSKLENDLWVCGQCLHEAIQKLKENSRKAFLEG